jgi:hypothetical protein
LDRVWVGLRVRRLTPMGVDVWLGETAQGEILSGQCTAARACACERRQTHRGQGAPSGLAASRHILDEAECGRRRRGGTAGGDWKCSGGAPHRLAGLAGTPPQPTPPSSAVNSGETVRETSGGARPMPCLYVEWRLLPTTRYASSRHANRGCAWVGVGSL